MSMEMCFFLNNRKKRTSFEPEKTTTTPIHQEKVK